MLVINHYSKFLMTDNSIQEIAQLYSIEGVSLLPVVGSDRNGYYRRDSLWLVNFMLNEVVPIIGIDVYLLKNNNITTTKYNFITFLPKGLFYQFSRLSNVYFLFTAIIQSIPIISPLTSLTAIVPLIFVLGVSMIREMIEDLSRHNYDNLNNGEEVIVLRENKFVKAMSETLRHGEIILLYENKQG